MKIGINASFLRKPDSGIGQVTHNFLRKLCELEVESLPEMLRTTKQAGEKLKVNEIRFILYLEEDVDLDLSDNFEKRVFLPKFYQRDDLIRKVIWEKYLLPKKVKEDGCDVLLSMYQSATVLNNPSEARGKNMESETLSVSLYKEGDKRIRHVMFVHDTVWKIFPQYLNNWRKKFYYKLVDDAITKADEIATISENSKKDIVKYFGIEENKIFANYIDCDEVFKSKIENPLSPPFSKGETGGFRKKTTVSYIFYVGGFDVRKNVDRLIESYGLLWKSWRGSKDAFPDLVLAGEFHPHLVPLVTNFPEKIKEVSEKYGLDKNKIKMIGFAKQDDLPDLYKNADLLCYPSLYEGFGLPPLEAQNCGCPVVTSNNSSLPEVTKDDSAILVDAENSEEIARTMERLLTEEDLRARIIQKGYENAKRFSWEEFAEKTLERLSDNDQ